MIRYICQRESPYIDEGRNLLIQEFGKKYGSYFSILDAISSGKNTQAEIEAFMGEKSIGGQLQKLETVYEVIKGSQNEIDIVGVYLDDKSAVAVEVKRQKKNFKPQLFEEKVKILKTKELNRHTVESLCWDFPDM